MALWVIACSGKKHEGDRAACVKYDSRAHRLMLDLFWQHRAPCGDDLAILSAEFGLVPATRALPDYDRKMDRRRSRELSASAEQIEAMAEALKGHDEVFVYGGKDYRDCVKALIAAAGRDEVEVVEIVGEGRGCGDHFSELSAMFAEGEAEIWSGAVEIEDRAEEAEVEEEVEAEPAAAPSQESKDEVLGSVRRDNRGNEYRLHAGAAYPAAWRGSISRHVVRGGRRARPPRPCSTRDRASDLGRDGARSGNLLRACLPGGGDRVGGRLRDLGARRLARLLGQPPAACRARGNLEPRVCAA
jgi:hypothetical protein